MSSEDEDSDDCIENEHDAESWTHKILDQIQNKYITKEELIEVLTDDLIDNEPSVKRIIGHENHVVDQSVSSPEITPQPPDGQSVSSRSPEVGSQLQQILTRHEVMDTSDAESPMQHPSLDILEHSSEVTYLLSTSNSVLKPRPSYSAMQLENFDTPSFDKSLQVNKVYTNRSTPISYFLDLFPESIQNTNIYEKEKKLVSGWMSQMQKFVHT
ncbi:unnamed protein product [Euphydryas editha]|uniref:Uncharacterized protein n=1 Tax=Euphydryas editha TaxID=104508 RepID=A0AAU9VA37_EUPED|nr:unnamed protein product [Euphydryas editha]